MPDVFDDIDEPTDVFDEVSSTQTPALDPLSNVSIQAQGLPPITLNPYDVAKQQGILSGRDAPHPEEVIPFLESFTKPPIPYTPIQGETTLGKIGAGVANVAGGIYNAIASPVGLATLPLGATELGAPILKGVFGGLAAKEAGTAFGEASVTHDPQRITEGLLNAALAGGITLPGSLPKTIQAATEAINESEVPNASEVSKATEVHGDVRPQQASTGELPKQEGVGGVQPQAEGGLPQEGQTPNPLLLKEQTPPAETGEVQPQAVTPSAPEAGKAETPVTAGAEPATPTVTQPVAETKPIPMGAATAEEFPGSKDSLAQLTENIKEQGRISPKESFSDRLGQALNAIAQKWKNRPQDVGQALERARAGSAVLLDKYLNLPKYTDFVKAIREWTGADNETALEVRRFVKQLRESVPNKLRQEAITNWIQADGDEALLKERAAASKPDVRPGYETALKLTEPEKTLARNIQSYLDSRLQEGMNTGILKQGVDNYVTQIWKRDTPPVKALWADLFGTGTLNPNFKYARRRIFDSYFTGEQAGFTPKDKSIGTLIGTYDLAFNRALSARALIKQLHEGTAEDGKPIVMISGKATPIGPQDAPPEAVLIKPNVAPEGAVSEDGRPYRSIDHWALRDWKWATKGPDGQPVFLQGDMLVHPDHYRHLNNVLKTSRLAQPEGLAHISRAALRLGAIAKQTKLSLSLFHLDQEGVHAMAHRVNPANLEELDLSKPNQKSLVYHGLQVADPRAQELFSEGLSGGGLVGKIPGLGQAQSWFNDFLFRDYIPRLKMNMALDALERNKKAYAKDLASGKITEDQIMALTADESNAAFGELNYRALGRSPTVQDFLRLSLLAPDFLEARARFVGQALKPYGREQRNALALMGATLFVGGRILNQWLDGDPHYDKPFSVIYKGREYRMRTILGDVQHLITDPRSFWYNRMSPITRALSEYVTGRDDRGIKRTSLEQFKDLAEWFKPILIQKRSDQTIGQAALQSVGVSSKKYDAPTQLFELVDKWKKNNPDPKIQQQYETHRQETLPDSAYRPMRDALQKGDGKQAKAEYQKLLKTHSVAQINTAMLPRKPFTGSWRNEQKFLSTLSPEQRNLYNAAVQQRQQLYNSYQRMRMSP